MRAKPLRALACTAATAGLALALLAGCAQQAPSLGEPADALGESYEQALAAVSERVDDPVLLAVQCTTTNTGEEPVWSYLFGSKAMAFMYTVSPNEETGEYGAATYGRLEWTDRSWDSIPSVDSIAISSTDALTAVEEACREADPMRTYSANLVTFLSGDGTSDASTNPMKWEVIVNANAEEELSGECYTVDAATGELSQKIAQDGGSDASSAGGEAEGTEPDLGPKGTGYRSNF